VGAAVLDEDERAAALPGEPVTLEQGAPGGAILAREPEPGRRIASEDEPDRAVAGTALAVVYDHRLRRFLVATP
jgi:hypothetical protein